MEDQSKVITGEVKKVKRLRNPKWSITRSDGKVLLLSKPARQYVDTLEQEIVRLSTDTNKDYIDRIDSLAREVKMLVETKNALVIELEQYSDDLKSARELLYTSESKVDYLTRALDNLTSLVVINQFPGE